MSDHTCAKCGADVRVPDGWDFDDGDLCWDCERAEAVATIARLQKQLAAAEKVIEAARRCGECAASPQTEAEQIEVCEAEIELVMAVTTYDAAREENQ